MTITTGNAPEPVDVEALAIDYLIALGSVTAIFGTPAEVASAYPPNIATHPNELTGPVARVSQVGESEVVGPGWLLRARLQVEVLAPTKAAASSALGVLQARLLDAPNVAHGAGVVTEVRIDIGRTWAPDELTDLPRYLAVFAFYCHP